MQAWLYIVYIYASMCVILFNKAINCEGAKGDWDFRIPDLVKDPDETSVVNFGKVQRAQLAKSTRLTSTMVPLGSFKIFSDAKERVGAGSNGKLPHLFIPSKTATLVPEFAVEDLPLGRTAALVPEFAVKDLPLGRTLMMMMINCK